MNLREKLHIEGERELQNQTSESHHVKVNPHNKTHSKPLGRINETYPKFGGNEDRHYYERHASNKSAELTNNTIFLQAEPMTEAESGQVRGMPWYVSILITVGGLLIMGFVIIFTKRYCHKNVDQEQDFHIVKANQMA